ncbi:hypothetical protein CSHISOI_10549, partial [Colletotrichum shisoi]
DLLCSTVEHQPSATDPTLRQFVTKTTAQYPQGQDTYAYLSMVHEMPKIRQVHAISKDLVRNMNPIELRAARNKIKTEKRRNIILGHLHQHWQDAGCHYAAEFNCPKIPQNVLECLKKITDLAMRTGTPLASLWAPEGPLRRAVNNHDPPKLTRSVAENALALAQAALNQELARSPSPSEPRSLSPSPSPSGHPPPQDGNKPGASIDLQVLLNKTTRKEEREPSTGAQSLPAAETPRGQGYQATKIRRQSEPSGSIHSRFGSPSPLSEDSMASPEMPRFNNSLFRFPTSGSGSNGEDHDKHDDRHDDDEHDEEFDEEDADGSMEMSVFDADLSIENAMIDVDYSIKNTAPLDRSNGGDDIETLLSRAKYTAERVINTLISSCWVPDDVIWFVTQTFRYISSQPPALTGRNVFVMDTYWLRLYNEALPKVMPPSALTEAGAVLLVPLHHGNHWTAATIEVTSKSVFFHHYDSIFSLPRFKAVQDTITPWLSRLCPGRNIVVESKVAPQQDDNVSCGVFVTCFIQSFLRGEHLPQSMNGEEERRRLLHDLRNAQVSATMPVYLRSIIQAIKINDSPAPEAATTQGPAVGSPLPLAGSKRKPETGSDSEPGTERNEMHSRTTTHTINGVSSAPEGCISTWVTSNGPGELRQRMIKARNDLQVARVTRDDVCRRLNEVRALEALRDKRAALLRSMAPRLPDDIAIEQAGSILPKAKELEDAERARFEQHVRHLQQANEMAVLSYLSPEHTGRTAALREELEEAEKNAHAAVRCLVDELRKIEAERGKKRKELAELRRAIDAASNDLEEAD